MAGRSHGGGSIHNDSRRGNERAYSVAASSFNEEVTGSKIRSRMRVSDEFLIRKVYPMRSGVEKRFAGGLLKSLSLVALAPQAPRRSGPRSNRKRSLGLSGSGFQDLRPQVGRGWAGGHLGELGEGDGRHFDVQVDPVQKRSRDSAGVLLDLLRRAATGAPGIGAIPARAWNPWKASDIAPRQTWRG